MKRFRKFFLNASILILMLHLMLLNSCSKESPTQPTPDPNDNLLPGVSYLGRGYNVFGEYAASEFIKSPLFQYNDFKKMSVEDKSYNIPEEIEYTFVNTADFKSVYGLNSFSYRSEMSVNASLSGSYSFFSMTLTNNYNQEHYRSNYKAFCTIQNIIKKWKLTLPYTEISKLRSMLTADARKDIAELSPEILFNKYGTHFIAELMIGARADYNTCITKCNETSTIKNNFAVCAEASFKKKSGCGSFNMVTEQQLQCFESNSFQKLKVSGGKSEYGSYIFQAGNYDRWIETIDNLENLTIADFTNNSLIPIWELCEDDSRKTELITSFELYAAQFNLPPLVDETIKELYFEVTTNPPVTPKDGWQILNVDLNRDAGGKFIYLCYKNGLDDQEAISAITFIINNQAVPPGFTRIPQNLNQGSGGASIFLCYKTEVTNNPIRRINILVGENTAPDPGFQFAKNYYSGVKQDLNQGAGGNFIWLVYSHNLPNPWQ